MCNKTSLFCNKINQLKSSYALVYISLMKQERNAFKMLAGCKMQTHEPRRWFFVSARLLNSLVSVDEDLSKVCKRWESCVKFVEARPPQIQDRKLAGNAAIWDIHEIQKEKKNSIKTSQYWFYQVILHFSQNYLQENRYCNSLKAVMKKRHGEKA